MAALHGRGSPEHRRALEEARAALDGPAEFPEELNHLYRWSLELVGRSGGGPDGPMRLSYSTIESWARLTHRAPSALEVEALILLDAALLERPANDEESTT